MITINIRVSGNDLAEKFAAYKPAVTAGIMAGANHVRSIIAQYPADSRPPRASVYGKTFVSDRQRRWFFAVGQFQTPYRRTGDLGRDWSVSSLSWLSAQIGNNRSYGIWVQSPENQALYHAARGWQTTDQVAESEQEKVEQILKKSIDAALGSK